MAMNCSTGAFFLEMLWSNHRVGGFAALRSMIGTKSRP